VPASSTARPRTVPDQIRLAAWRAFLTAHAAVVSRIEADVANDQPQPAGSQALLPLTWYDVLLELVEAPGHVLRQRDLARRVVLTRSGISRLVGRLELAGLLTRQPNEHDRRGELVVLTDAGYAAVRRTWPAYARAIERRFAQYLSQDEARVLVRVFERVRLAMQHQPVAPA
jgi:DNA-binding MarR family transcriptional regulator